MWYVAFGAPQHAICSVFKLTQRFVHCLYCPNHRTCVCTCASHVEYRMCSNYGWRFMTQASPAYFREICIWCKDEVGSISLLYACWTTNVDYHRIDCCVFCGSFCIKVQPSITIHDDLCQLHTITAHGGPVQPGILWIRRHSTYVLETI